MPRPEQKPRTEGGKALKDELLAFIEETVIVNNDDRTDTIIEFFIDKIVDLQEKIDELS